MPQTGTEVLRETFELTARRTSAAEARRLTLAWLTRHAVARQATETAVLIVSELVTNAVVHSGSAIINCTVQLSGSVLRVEVTDRGAGQASPAVRHAATDEVSGRGLLLVSAVAESWGSSPAIPCGWTVWAAVRTTALPAAGHPAAARIVQGVRQLPCTRSG